MYLKSQPGWIVKRANYRFIYDTCDNLTQMIYVVNLL